MTVVVVTVAVAAAAAAMAERYSSERSDSSSNSGSSNSRSNNRSSGSSSTHLVGKKPPKHDTHVLEALKMLASAVRAGKILQRLVFGRIFASKNEAMQDFVQTVFSSQAQLQKCSTLQPFVGLDGPLPPLTYMYMVAQCICSLNSDPNACFFGMPPPAIKGLRLKIQFATPIVKCEPAWKLGQINVALMFNHKRSHPRGLAACGTMSMMHLFWL